MSKGGNITIATDSVATIYQLDEKTDDKEETSCISIENAHAIREKVLGGRHVLLQSLQEDNQGNPSFLVQQLSASGAVLDDEVGNCYMVPDVGRKLCARPNEKCSPQGRRRLYLGNVIFGIDLDIYLGIRVVPSDG